MFQSVRQTFQLIHPRMRPGLALLIGFILLNTALEGVGVGLVLPFAQLVIDPSKARQGVAGELAAFFGLSSDAQILTGAGVALLGVMAVKNLAQVASVVWQVVFSRHAEVAATSTLLTSYMRRPYLFHLQQNSSTLVTTLNDLIPAVFAGFLIPALRVLAELLVVLVVMGVLAAISPEVTFAVAGGLIVTAGLIYGGLQGFLRRWGATRVRLVARRLLVLQHALGAVKEAQVLGRDEYFRDVYVDIATHINQLNLRITAAGEIRRTAIEMLVVAVAVVLVIYYSAGGRGGSGDIAFLGVFAVAALRLMPSANRILMALESMRAGAAYVDKVYEDFPGFTPPPRRTGGSLALRHAIRFDGVTFTYPGGDRPALDGIDLAIAKGESVGLIGLSGAGKSTLMDVLLGLLPPDRGTLWVDDRDIFADPRPWQDLIGYVPQKIFLADDTLRRNIALGVTDTEIDDARVWAALEMAQLAEVARGLPDGLLTRIGESGVRLSGGQRQRIGIARALYHDTEVLVLDEATSALDNETERDITEAIGSLRGKKTLVVVAHRLSTLRQCDRLVVMGHGRILDSGTFTELYQRCAEFHRMVDLADIGGLLHEAEPAEGRE